MGYSDFASGGGAFYTTIKYSSAGLPLWTNWYNSTPDCYCNNFPRAMALDRSGNVFVTGRSPSVNLNDYTTIKYDCTTGKTSRTLDSNLRISGRYQKAIHDF